MERFLIDDGIKQSKIVANRYKWSAENADMGSEDANELHWDCGKNYELEEVIENVIATLDSLCTQKILWNIEKKRKKKHVQHNK